MPNSIQSLESRRLCSASVHDVSSDVSQVVSEIRSIRSPLLDGQRTELADRRAITADLRAAGGRANGRLSAGLLRDDAADWAHVFAAAGTLMAKGSALSHRAAADGTLLLNHAGNAAFQSRVSADAAALGSQIATFLAAVQNEYVAAEQTRNADLAAIATANPTIAALPGHVQTIQNDEAATSAVLGATAVLVQADANRLAADLASLTTG